MYRQSVLAVHVESRNIQVFLVCMAIATELYLSLPLPVTVAV